MTGTNAYLDESRDWNITKPDNDRIQFRGAAEKEAVRALDKIRLGRIHTSEIAREELTEMLRRMLTDKELKG